MIVDEYLTASPYPDDKASQNARNIASILQEQIKLLQKENKSIVEKSQEVKKDLDIRVSEMADILQLLDTYSSKTIIDLNDGIKSLSDKCGYITDKTTNTVLHLKDCSNDISLSSEKFVSKINPILDEISALSSNVKNNIADNKVTQINNGVSFDGNTININVGASETQYVGQGGAIYNNAAQVLNHRFFFDSLTPQQGKMPKILSDIIITNFGSTDSFKEQFTNMEKINSYVYGTINENLTATGANQIIKQLSKEE